ncbi:MAG: hypothetical protein KA149_06495, partial [Chitinophagales bacterium]|nr:hypothetical protein [Chitinophagales bacterium]
YSIPNYTSVSDLQLIPLTINCKKLSKFKVGHNYNPQYLIEKILELNGFELKDERKLITQLTSYFKQQKVIIIIDGIEEIQDTELRDKFCLYIDGLVDNYSENFFVLTSRIYGYTGIKHIIRGDFLPLRIQDLSKESKQIFLNRISACLNLTKKDQQVILTELNNRHIESLTRTALNLTNICLLYKSKNQFPSNLREVYLGSLEILFARKNISAGITYPLNKELKLLLGKLSYDLLINNKIEFTQADFSNTLNHFLSYYSVENKSIRNGKKIFSYIRSQVGLFDDVRVENNKGEIQEVYKFFHDSYREFLAGYFISSYNFNQDHIVERIHEIIKYESYITKIKRKEVKLLKISDGRFSIINFAIACCDPKEKIEVLNSLIKGGSKINQTQKLKANGVMALHCISNNPEKALTHVAKKVFKFFCSHIDKNDYSISLKNISEETKGKVDATETNFALKRIVDSSWSKLFTQAVLEQYLESYNSESINSEKLQLIYLDLILQSSLNLKSNKNYLECNIIKRRFEEKLRYCFDIVNIGYTEASTYPTEQFKKSVKKVVANLFIILGGENSILRSAAAFALYWLNNAKSSPKGIWEPNQKEYNLLVEIILKLKDRDVCLSIFPVLRKSCDKKVFYEGNVALQVASWLDRKTIEIPVIKLKEINAKLCGVLIQLFNSTHLDSLKSLCAIELASYGYYDNRISKYLITQIDSFNESRVVKIVVPYIIALNDLTIAPKLLGLLLKDDMNTSFYATLILSRYLNRSNYEMIKENSNMQLQKKFRRNVATLSKTLKKWEENRTSYYDYCIKLLSDDCYQVMGKDTSGQTAWYFVLVDPDKVVSFTKHKQGDSYDLKNYGVIVRAGYGESVPEKVQKELKDKYGFDNF